MNTASDVGSTKKWVRLLVHCSRTRYPDKSSRKKLRKWLKDKVAYAAVRRVSGPTLDAYARIGPAFYALEFKTKRNNGYAK